MGIYSLLITHYLKKERIVHKFFTPEKVQSQQPRLVLLGGSQSILDFRFWILD
jgi:hypothetical protein